MECLQVMYDEGNDDFIISNMCMYDLSASKKVIMILKNSGFA